MRSEGHGVRHLFAGLVLWALLGSGPTGCSGGDSSADLGRSSVSDSGRNLSSEPRRNSASEIGQGLLYKNDWIRTVPWSIHLLRIDRSRSDFELVTALSQDSILGLGPLTEQIRTIPAERGRPLAAMNGDFYSEHSSFAGDPRGLQIMRGELVSGPNGTACFWIDPQGVPHMSNVLSRLRVTWPSGETSALGLNEERRLTGAVLYTPRLGYSTRTGAGRELILERAGQGAWLPLRPGQTYTAQIREVRETGNTRLSNDIMVLSLGPFLATRLSGLARGAVLKISTATSPDLSGVQMALGGGPALVRQGQVQDADDHRSFQRHPRAAFGWNSKYYFFVAVDGRQPGLSMGMTLPDLAAYLARQGCEEALNLDGGGSVEMWVEGKIVNSPCYGYERSTANSLALVQKNQSRPPEVSSQQAGGGGVQSK